MMSIIPPESGSLLIKKNLFENFLFKIMDHTIVFFRTGSEEGWKPIILFL